MRPFFRRKLWESIFLLILQNVFRTGSVHWASLFSYCFGLGFFFLFFFASVDMTSCDFSVKLTGLIDRLGTFCPNSSCVRSSCFSATYKHGHTEFSETSPRRSHTAAFPMTLQPLPKQPRLPAKRLNNCFSQKLCSWCPISYQNNLPVPRAGKSPWEINYSKNKTKRKKREMRLEEEIGKGRSEKENLG